MFIVQSHLDQLKQKKEMSNVEHQRMHAVLHQPLTPSFNQLNSSFTRFATFTWLTSFTHKISDMIVTTFSGAFSPQNQIFSCPPQIEANPMIVLWRGNGVHVLRADIGPINLIYWAFNGILSAFTKSYILQYMQYMHYMRSKSSHTFILTVVRKVGLGARMNISWPISYIPYHICA